MDGIDSTHTGRSRVLLPVDPVVRKQVRLTADLRNAAAVDESGRVVAATTDGAARDLDENRVHWEVELPAPPALAPVITSDGTRVFFTERRDVVGLTPNGREVFHTRLEGASGDLRASPISTRDGGIVVGVGRRLVRLDSKGNVLATSAFSSAVLGVVERGRSLVVAELSGDVFEWTAPEAPRRLGSLGGPPSSDVVLHGAGLVAVVRDSNLVELDLVRGSRESFGAVAPDTYVGAPSVGSNGELRVALRRAAVLAYRGGRENARVPLPTKPSPAGAGPTVSTRALVDASGTVAIALPGTLAVVLGDGDARTVDLPGCPAPFGVWPAGPRRLVVGCRNGTLVWIGTGSSGGSPDGRSQTP